MGTTTTEKMKLKAGIYDPYLDTLGGGERYCLTIAEILSQHGYEVDLFWSGDPAFLKTAQDRFNLDLSQINIVPDIFGSHPQKVELVDNLPDLNKTIIHSLPQSANILDKFKKFIYKFQTTRQYDLIFFLSDWSVPFLFSQNNLLHVQVPFAQSVSLKSSISNFCKTLFLRQIICNSQFTSKFAGSYFGRKCLILYPPVDVDKFDSHQPKENIIVSVGRFDDILNIKKQDILIDAFKNLRSHNSSNDWRLILAGGSLESPEKNSYLHHLQYLATGLPVEFIINPSFSQLKDVYAKGKIYWHAAGYQVDELTHPEHTEHFGMTPVEAMASGLVPLLVKKGGLPEIVTHNVDGFLWEDISELVAKTQLLIASPPTLNDMSQKAILKSSQFSKEKFINNLSTLIKL